VKRGIKKYGGEFATILALVVLAAAVAVYITAHERLALPTWVPGVHKQFKLDFEFSTAQAVTPGQGQTVDISGVQVGRVTGVSLRDGRALVSTEVQSKYAHVYPNATVLLRPKTGLKDMVLELDPGSPSSGQELKSGATVPVSNTLPDVNLDEVLAGLDGDTRDYLQLLVAAGGEGLGRDNGERLASVLRRFDPTARNLARAASLVADRRQNLRRVIHNFQLLATELGKNDKQLSQFVVNSNGVFKRFAAQNQNLGETVSLLPSALAAANNALVKTDRLAKTLGPTLGQLQPAARALGPSLKASQPFLRGSTPIIRDQLRPFARKAQPVVKTLAPAAHDLSAATPKLTTVGSVLNYLLNELAYKPPGGNGIANQGYLFYLPWANHNTNQIFSGQDALGPVRRGIVLVSCNGLGLLGPLADLSSPAHNPTLATIISLLNPPTPSEAGCPGASP
jgi:phospholipid/cholesterol/gamma-HCH transport system substrate-binding protein